MNKRAKNTVSTPDYWFISIDDKDHFINPLSFLSVLILSVSQARNNFLDSTNIFK